MKESDRQARSRQAAQSRRRMITDFAVIFGLAAGLWIVTIPLDLFERFHEFTRSHEAWELDEMGVALVFFCLGLIAFGARRIRDQQRELQLRVAAERRVINFAYFDQSTGLPNRRRFREIIGSGAASQAGLDAIVLLDLDAFTPINDMFGEEVGDEALRIIVDRLRPFGKAGSVVARVGGDEFGFYLKGLSGREEAKQVAEAILAAAREPILVAGERLEIQASVGMSLIDDAGLAPEVFIKRANVALRRAKQQKSKDSFVLYQPGMGTAAFERTGVEQNLSRALAEGQFFPVYQPIVRLEDGRIRGFEALARWNHPVRGVLGPQQFISIAEEAGLIRDITDAIFRQAFADARTWPSHIKLSINLSAVLLGDQTYPLRLVTLISESGIQPHRLIVEITEGALEADTAHVEPFVAQLQALGVRISLDDFGTGYSSLARLQDIRFDEIKIDKSFTRGIGTPESAAIIRSIIQLGQGLGATLTGEGVEQASERDWLLAEGCQNGQGYLFARPMRAEAAAEVLTRELTGHAVTEAPRQAVGQF